jgi:hypothetical protein
MAFSTLMSILGIRQVLIVQLEEGVEKSFTHEVEEFRRLTKDETQPLLNLSG